MRKLMIITGLAAGSLSASMLGWGQAASAADSHAASPLLAYGDDGDDDDEESRGGSGSGALAATGTDATSLALIGALTLAVGGATYRVALRRPTRR